MMYRKWRVRSRKRMFGEMIYIIYPIRFLFRSSAEKLANEWQAEANAEKSDRLYEVISLEDHVHE
jgi:hypothetical protein